MNKLIIKNNTTNTKTNLIKLSGLWFISQKSVAKGLLYKFNPVLQLTTTKKRFFIWVFGYLGIWGLRFFLFLILI